VPAAHPSAAAAQSFPASLQSRDTDPPHNHRPSSSHCSNHAAPSSQCLKSAHSFTQHSDREQLWPHLERALHKHRHRQRASGSFNKENHGDSEEAAAARYCHPPASPSDNALAAADKQEADCSGRAQSLALLGFSDRRIRRVTSSPFTPLWHFALHPSLHSGILRFTLHSTLAFCASPFTPLWHFALHLVRS
jgi:hypothetical protein